MVRNVAKNLNRSILEVEKLYVPCRRKHCVRGPQSYNRCWVPKASSEMFRDFWRETHITVEAPGTSGFKRYAHPGWVQKAGHWQQQYPRDEWVPDLDAHLWLRCTTSQISSLHLLVATECAGRNDAHAFSLVFHTWTLSFPTFFQRGKEKGRTSRDVCIRMYWSSKHFLRGVRGELARHMSEVLLSLAAAQDSEGVCT